jgi:hypothetical protein
VRQCLAAVGAQGGARVHLGVLWATRHMAGCVLLLLPGRGWGWFQHRMCCPCRRPGTRSGSMGLSSPAWTCTGEGEGVRAATAGGLGGSRRGRGGGKGCELPFLSSA